MNYWRIAKGSTRYTRFSGSGISRYSKLDTSAPISDYLKTTYPDEETQDKIKKRDEYIGVAVLSAICLLLIWLAY